MTTFSAGRRDLTQLPLHRWNRRYTVVWTNLPTASCHGSTSQLTLFLFLFRSKKVSVPSTVISRVIGRGGCNINAIRECTGAHIDIDKQKDKTGDRIITIR